MKKILKKRKITQKSLYDKICKRYETPVGQYALSEIVNGKKLKREFLSSNDDSHLKNSLAILAARGLVVSVTGESVSKMMKFTHQIITESAYSLMLDSQKREVHKAIANEYENASFKLVSVYAGIGYNSGITNLKLNGDFDLKYEIDSSQTVEVQPGFDLPLIDVLREVPGVDVNSNDEVVVTVQDPIDSEFEANGMRTTIGARLNLGFFKIFADYTFQEYNTASAGIVFSFN